MNIRVDQDRDCLIVSWGHQRRHVQMKPDEAASLAIALYDLADQASRSPERRRNLNRPFAVSVRSVDGAVVVLLDQLRDRLFMPWAVARRVADELVSKASLARQNIGRIIFHNTGVS